MGQDANRIKSSSLFDFVCHARFPRINPWKSKRRGGGRGRVESGGAVRDDMVAKARDQTGMIITRVVNTSLDVILF